MKPEGYRRAMKPHARPLASSCIAATLLCGLIGSTERAAATDLPTHKPTTTVVYAVSPCVEYRRIYTDALATARRIAREFRADNRTFHRLKRRRVNDGFDGPDIRVNAKMTGEQIDVAVLTTRAEIFVAKARQLHCSAPASLNLVDNEAANLHREITQATIWIDPPTYQ
jgi:hypothetical protein